MIRNKFSLILLLAHVMLGTTGCGTAPSPTPGAGSSRPPVSRLRVTFLDVGQGDAALIQSPDGKNLLIDGGPSQAGPKLVEALRLAGVKELSLLIGSHPHEDHIGGLLHVLRSTSVLEALDPGYVHGTSTQRTYLQLLKEHGVKVSRAQEGVDRDFGDSVRLEVLAPQQPLLSGTDADANNNSVVARLVHGNNRFLFTGDMENAERDRLLRNIPAERLRSEVLKVAHHGSHNGTDSAFLKTVRPEYGVISLGRDNDYGHPHAETLRELESAGTRILRTDELGSITFTSDGKRLELAPLAKNAKTETPNGYLGKVIGNRNSHIYHAPECRALPGANNRLLIKSPAAARALGYLPHRPCMRELEGTK